MLGWYIGRADTCDSNKNLHEFLTVVTVCFNEVEEIYLGGGGGGSSFYAVAPQWLFVKN